MQTLTLEQYYLALAHYLVASEAQKQVRREERLLHEIIKNEKINDMIYDPMKQGTKKEYDEFLLEAGFMVEWKKPENRIYKEEKKEVI